MLIASDDNDPVDSLSPVFDRFTLSGGEAVKLEKPVKRKMAKLCAADGSAASRSITRPSTSISAHVVGRLAGAEDQLSSSRKCESTNWELQRSVAVAFEAHHMRGSCFAVGNLERGSAD
ncbi:hypothetical protein PR001_g14538 [Phytophthora rubi]|uniref:Uncharacterized protein n=1 Tax=Phytophthora rubi TaxID=129364 RepID=A0A6A3LBR7_9STRA|nr:hypothetical protein PR001_g14538 [Phytophthora rubi]